MIKTVRIRRLELAFSPRAWPFAEAHRSEIASHFDQLRRVKPSIWNGRILLLHDHLIEDDIFQGAYFETDYASFVAWRDWGFPDATVRHCFSFGALRGCDGNFIVGVMNSHTLNAGKVVFPAGMPEPSDIVSGVVDLAGSVRREVAEETGLNADALRAEEGWYCVSTWPYIAHFKMLHASEPAAALRARILSYLATEKQPELADIRIVHDPADLDPMMPNTVVTFLRHVWSGHRNDRHGHPSDARS